MGWSNYCCFSVCSLKWDVVVCTPEALQTAKPTSSLENRSHDGFVPLFVSRLDCADLEKRLSYKIF